MAKKTTKKTKTQKRKKVVFDSLKLEALPVVSIYYAPFITSLKVAVKKHVAFKHSRQFIKTLKRLSKKYGDEEKPKLATPAPKPRTATKKDRSR